MQGYFYGWYLKCQSKDETIAFIVARHKNGKSETSSLQIITKDGAYNIDMPGKAFRKDRVNIFLGKNRFGRNGIRVNMDNPGMRIKAKLDFGSLTPIKYDIMGPFALIPFMECRHAVLSMRHSVNGKVSINGKKYAFENALGYWEGDSGKSFPKEYLWTQTFFGGGSVMLSVAHIPFGALNFTGIIGIVYYNQKEYRFATYLGAYIRELRDKKVRIKQGTMELEAGILEADAKALNAPVTGLMTRTIHESASCKAYYKFRVNGKTIFSFKTNRASFEYEYPY
ncbi:MAG: hypothetical protein J5856_07470 [Lachnospiraceae bacterium]|nr:hypothetical protein [Lachnospiraceae bacterium]